MDKTQSETELDQKIKNLFSTYIQSKEQIQREVERGKLIELKLFQYFCNQVKTISTDEANRMLSLEPDTFTIMVNNFYGNTYNEDILAKCFRHALLMKTM